MSKVDRWVFIFIGLGIWALAMTQVFDATKLKAAKTGATWDSPNITAVTRPCPSNINNFDGNDEITDCHYLLTIPHDQLVARSKLFK
jgi:hypothetical protein